jgi:selenium metabolism protein YedF
MPVIRTKKALEESQGEQLEIRVDNGISLENVQKYLYSRGHRDTVCVTRDGHFAVIVNTGAAAKKVKSNDTDSIVVISGDVMGKGDENLGRRLMQGFVYALTQLEVLPHRVILYNRGILLAVEGSPTLGDLHILTISGVQILSCGLCIDYFGCGDKLAVGEITNMYAIVEMMQGGNVNRP